MDTTVFDRLHEKPVAIFGSRKDREESRQPRILEILCRINFKRGETFSRGKTFRGDTVMRLVERLALWKTSSVARGVSTGTYLCRIKVEK